MGSAFSNRLECIKTYFIIALPTTTTVDTGNTTSSYSSSNDGGSSGSSIGLIVGVIAALVVVFGVVSMGLVFYFKVYKKKLNAGKPIIENTKPRFEGNSNQSFILKIRLNYI